MPRAFDDRIGEVRFAPILSVSGLGAQANRMTGKPQEGRKLALTNSECVARWSARHQRRCDRKRKPHDGYAAAPNWEAFTTGWATNEAARR
jgi:hypothetical protein